MVWVFNYRVMYELCLTWDFIAWIRQVDSCVATSEVVKSSSMGAAFFSFNCIYQRRLRAVQFGVGGGKVSQIDTDKLDT
jgi:hypothetical protein